MKIIRCKNGHFYDGSTYPVCPHCNQSESLELYRNSSNVRPSAQLQPDTNSVTMPLESSKQDPVTIPLESDSEYPVTIPLIQPEPEKILDVVRTAENDTRRTTIQAELVTGWLVCIKGENFGRSFPLKSGSNFIGASFGMDVSAKEKLAEVFYDARLRIFVVKTGTSTKQVRLNHEILRRDTQLREYDILSAGDVNLMFIPCCGEKFSWENVG